MVDVYFDHNVSRHLAAPLIAAGLAVLTARDAGRDYADDDEHLLFATSERRVLISHNARDFTLLHGAWHRWSRAWGVREEHAGIVLLPQPRSLDYASVLISLLDSNALFSNTLYCWKSGRWDRIEVR
ncbi:MAG: DUF5615 family PIN-like protein [Dehalococcoidia bacterium]